ncbi:dTMP kinase [Alteribacillus sp. HJP-4]|uniref:dTMP kinase n=1 Tax=Alteribacillus sp. HJP-4 TaxID=2775394 RepID=UPI0035CCE193
MRERGVFVSLEGGEGAGKTTVAELIFELLVAKGWRVMKTREPGGIDIAEKIRTIILDPEHTAMEARTEALLYAAARRQHLIEKVLPALQEGYIVLCDRFVDSSLAYQGAARGIGIDEVFSINAFAIENQMPDLTLLLDIKPEDGMARIHGNENREYNRLDREKMEFHHKVYEAYQEISARFPERIHKIDANRPAEEVAAEVGAVLTAYLVKHFK